MPEPTATEIPVPPGEYQFPGLGGRILVIAGPAKIKAPAGPIDLLSLLGGQPTPAPAADPTPSAPKLPGWLTALLAVLALLAGAKIPDLWPAGTDPIPIPAPPEPARPEPTPAPAPAPPAPGPRPEPNGADRPDWLPEPEGAEPSAVGPVVYPPPPPVYPSPQS